MGDGAQRDEKTKKKNKCKEKEEKVSRQRCSSSAQHEAEKKRILGRRR